ncbi:MAG: phosphoglycerate dehydrogenase [Alphaproteobacteria bacterium TMED93]|nr:MAG: phosphoglycerate dehydrogenase [Alphaproteobacteria bacterium TMED93]
MNKILIADKLSAEAEKIFLANNIACDIKTGLNENEIIDIVKNYNGIVVRSATKITEKIINSGSNLKVLGRAGIGVDNIDISAATDKGIVVMNTPYGNSITTAEHTLSLMMSLARNISQADQSTKLGKWEKSKFMGTELFCKVLGMIGCGNIGALVAERSIGLKMKVIVYDPFVSEEQLNKIGAKKVELKEIFKLADFITLHTPLTSETKGILNKKTMLECKKGVRIINCARGGLVVEEDLLELLDNSHIAGAALDVFDEEPPKNSSLFKSENLILTPHLGASTKEAQENVAIQIAQQISDFLLNEVIVNSINVSPINIEEAPILKPYLELCKNLGKFGGQIIESNIKKINISFKGSVSKINTKPLISSLIASILSTKMESINLINAEVVAKQKNIEIITSFQDQTESHDSEISINLITEKEKFNFSGALFAGSSRIISINGMRIEAEISKNMLYTSNTDKPGFIGALGTELGNAEVNIATFNLGRTGSGEAVSLIEVDGKINSELIKKLENISNVKSIKKLSF